MTEKLNIAAERLNKIRKIYEEDPGKDKFNALITGEPGSGKTYLLRTAPKPVLIHSFDPGGARGLKDLIDKGEVIYDNRFELEDPEDPNVYRKWVQEVELDVKDGIFNFIGTYAIDSLTTWGDAMMNFILDVDKKGSRAGQNPQIQDYGNQFRMIRNAIQKITAFPCNFVMTAHLEAVKNELTGQIKYVPFTYGKMAYRLPSLFDEIYVMQTRPTSSGPTFKIQTGNDSMYTARTRIGAGKFDFKEEADLKALMEKAGLDSSDKSLS